MGKDTSQFCLVLFSPVGEMKGEVYPFGIVGMANKGDCLQKGETVKFQLCVLGQNGQTMAVNITPFRRATVECVKDQVSDCCYEDKMHVDRKLLLGLA